MKALIHLVSYIMKAGIDATTFGRNQTWKSARLADLPESTTYYMYKSGPLQQPNWPEMSHSLMTSLPPASPPSSPHVSFPPSAF